MLNKLILNENKCIQWARQINGSYIYIKDRQQTKKHTEEYNTIPWKIKVACQTKFGKGAKEKQKGPVVKNILNLAK